MRNVVVTGGSQGIGKATVKAFLAEGDRVLFTSRHAEPAERLMEELKSDRLFYLNGDSALSLIHI